VFENCKKSPIFNYINETKGLYCKTHKLDEMIDVINEKCLFENCVKRPSYNYFGEKERKYCVKHKLENMVNVKHKKCVFENCNTIPAFNFENIKKASHCSIHKLEGMINVVSVRCVFENCNTIPKYNFKNYKHGKYCVSHKLDGMVDVKHKKCKTDNCGTLATIPKYKGYCLRCFVHTFPNEPNARNYKTKEFTVVAFVKANFPDFHWISDRIIKDGCSKRRPDLFLDLGYQVIIVEIDEDRHKNYSCEHKRMMEISQDINHRPVIFIRFNPDIYIDDGEKIASCWHVNKLGLCVVKKNKIEDWNYRLEALKNRITYWSNTVSVRTLEVDSLFFGDEQ
jgi:hypothetical protein